MGHTHGIRWTDDMIVEGVLKVKETLKLDRMPTKSEIVSVTGNNALACKLTKTKGLYYWAERLGLSVKDSETTLGKKYESLIEEDLKSRKFEVKRMSQNYPFDLLVNGNIKVDVKSAKPYKCSEGTWHTFNLEKKYATCDIYICVCLSEKEIIERILIIPSKELKITQLSVGKESIYNKYIDRYDFIEKYNIFYNLI